jgi:hypothetical protein
MLGQPFSYAACEILDVIRMPRRDQVCIDDDRLVVAPDATVLLDD